MPRFIPPHLEGAFSALAEDLQRVEGQPVDLLKQPWADIEKGVIKLLMGPFDVRRPEHQAVALGLAAAFGERLAVDDGGFWFPNREAPEGAMIGFGDALIMLGPLGAVLESLSRSKLARLDEVTAEVRRALAEARLGLQANPGMRRLDPMAYARLFDPGFVQFTRLDPAKAKQAWEQRPDSLARDLREAIGRATSRLSTDPARARQAAQQIEGQLVTGLSRLDPAQPTISQLGRAPRLIETLGPLFAAGAGTAAAPEEFWSAAVFPLVYVGLPERFPPLEAADLEELEQGASVLALYLDMVPYAEPAPEDGLMGAFAANEIGVPHPELAKLAPPRLLTLTTERIQALLDKVDPARSRACLNRFQAEVEAKLGKPVPPSPEADQLCDAAFKLLEDLKRLMTAPGELVLRRMTEAEAQSEGALQPIREALQGPRIILAP